MERDRQIDDRSRVPGTTRRVLIAVHGREPAGWELELCRTLTLSPQTVVRVLAVADVPSLPSAALLPSARRTRARARAEWRRLEEATVNRRLEALLAGLPLVPDVVWVRVADADPGRSDRRAGGGLGRRPDRGRSGWGELAGAAAPRRRPRAGGRPGELRRSRHAAGGAGHASALERRIRLSAREAPGGHREGRGVTRWPRSFRSRSTGGCTRPSREGCCSSSSSTSSCCTATPTRCASGRRWGGARHGSASP